MRITQGGVYVMVKKFGIEGLLVTQGKSLQCNPEKETALVNGKQFRVFDRINVEIKAEMVEFKRSVSLIYSE